LDFFRKSSAEILHGGAPSIASAAATDHWPKTGATADRVDFCMSIPFWLCFFGGCVALLGPEGKRSPLDPIFQFVEPAGIEMKRGVIGRRSGLKLITPSVNVFVNIRIMSN
jgi:hypothetical protein